MAATNSEDPRLAGRVAFTYPNFVSYTFARFFIVLALEMQSVAVGWQVYEITKSPLDLGYVGLAQFAPPFLLFLFSIRRTRRRSLRPPQAAHVVLCRLWPVLGISAGNQLASATLGALNPSLLHLRRPRVGRSRALLQLPRKPSHPAAPRSRRAFLERSRLELQHLPDRNHRRPGRRRNRLCRL